jgi:site-specific recombinase XerD
VIVESNLQFLIDGFLLDREAEGRSPKTIRHHRLSLSLFSSWVADKGLSPDPSDWRAHEVRSYLAHLQERPSAKGGRLAGHSVTSYATSLLAFLRWLNEEGYTEGDLAERIRKPKAPALIKEPLSTEDAKRLVKAAEADRRNGVRDVAILHVLLDCGLRAQELCGLREDAISWDSRLIRVHGKGDKERFVPFSAVSLRSMRRYAVKGRRGDGPTFFQTEEGTTLTPTGLYRIIHRVSQRAGLTGVHPHRFRHTAAITYLRNGGDVMTLKRILGHSALSTTEHYLALTVDDLAAAHRSYSPVMSLLDEKKGRAK